MSFYRDRQIRNYCFFLTGCVLILFLFGIMIHVKQAGIARGLFLEHDRAVAASLLEHGVQEDLVAKAITNTSDVGTGKEFLDRIGISEHTAPAFLPLIVRFQRYTAAFMLLAGSSVSAALLAGTFFFFKRRERLYNHAAKTVSYYIEGDFSHHLPRLEEGMVYQFFDAVDRLSTILQARSDAQEKTKEFLKNTIADISHQLKTPLAALSMYQEIISDEPEHADVVRKYAEKTGQALKRMEQLIQSMLKITRLDAGSIEFVKEQLPVGALIAHSIGDLTTRAENEGKQILMEGSEDEMLTCDGEWTREAIGNIVKNALDHTGADGRILISWERSPAMLRICIADNGAGIAPEDIHHIFKRFYRSRKSSDTQGVGLGLPLAKSIIEGQGGILSVKSCLDTGTVFTISFLTEL